MQDDASDGRLGPLHHVAEVVAQRRQQNGSPAEHFKALEHDARDQRETGAEGPAEVAEPAEPKGPPGVGPAEAPLKTAEERLADVSTMRTTALAGSHWTPTLVAERLEEATDVLSRLPHRRTGGFYHLWPRLVGAAGRGPIPAAPAPEAIDRMDVAIGWLCCLEPEERRLVWLRAEGVPWKRITYRLGIGRTTAWQRWSMALLKISVRLNAENEQRRLNTKTVNKRAGSVLEST